MLRTCVKSAGTSFFIVTFKSEWIFDGLSTYAGPRPAAAPECQPPGVGPHMARVDGRNSGAVAAPARDFDTPASFRQTSRRGSPPSCDRPPEAPVDQP